MKKIRPVLETTLVRCAIWLLPKLQRRTILALSHVLGALAYAIDHRGRATSHENLRAAFAREHITEDQVRRIALASYQVFARTFLDLFWSLRLNRENHGDYILLSMKDPGTEALARERGALWVTPHFGNFELVSLLMGFRGFSFVIVAQDFKNPALTKIFTRLRQSSGHNVIRQEGAMLRLVKELKRQGHAALLTDLTVPPNKAAAAIECFGLRTCVTTLHTTLAQRLSLPVIAGVCLPLPDGAYRVTTASPFLPEAYPDASTMTQAVWDWFEQEIRQSPEAWMWMYKHWRFLPTKEPDARYPSYANRSREFRDLIALSKKRAGAASAE
ncbi:MAG: lysophospholipid acyltransferase family protein [Roseimicrobium sp.]